LNRIARINVSANAADFRLMDVKVVASIRTMKERARFLRGLISWVGYKQDFIPYKANARLLGETKYSFLRMVSFAIDGITSFSSFPLRLSIYVGLIIAFFSFIYIIYAIGARLLSITIPGWTSVLVAVLFMGGVQLIFLGIIGEYLARVYEETKQRPLYIIKEKIDFNKKVGDNS
jgi:dolichol-phosphate mannosyltransferase